jgi:hypothetical protein
MLRYDSTDGTHIDANIENIDYAIMGIRLKTSHIGATVKLINASLSEHSGNKLFEWKLLLNPTVAGTFTYVDVPQSAIQTAKGATANTVTGGYKLAGGMGASGVKGDAGMQQLENAIRLGSFIDGTVDEMVLAVSPVGGTINLDIEGGLTWRELL